MTYCMDEVGIVMRHANPRLRRTVPQSHSRRLPIAAVRLLCGLTGLSHILPLRHDLGPQIDHYIPQGRDGVFRIGYGFALP